MAVEYTLSEKENPLDRGVKKTYAQAVSSGTVTFEELIEEVAGVSTTVSPTDVRAVISEVIRILILHLQAGRTVDLGFGLFKISFKSKGADSPAEFHVSMIHSPRVLFRANRKFFGKLLKNLIYNKRRVKNQDGD